MAGLRQSKTKRVVAWSVTLAFVFNLLLPLFASYSISLAQASGTGNKVLLCTAEGYKWVSLEIPTEQAPAPDSTQHYKCPLCLLQLDKPVVTHSEPVFLKVASTFIAVSTTATYVQSLKTRRLLLGRTARAPPALIS